MSDKLGPYPLNSIVTGDCRELAQAIPDESVDLVLTDPPYFRVKDEPWDRQWEDETKFLEWLERIAIEWRRMLKPNGSLYVFASPQLSAKVELMIGRHFRVLNNIRWIKDEGWHKKAEKESLRSYLSPWEAIIFAEQYADRYGEMERALHKEVYAPIGRYIQLERERAGLTRNDVEVALGYVSGSDPSRGTALCYRWEEGSSLPTRDDYYRLRDLLNKSGEYEYLRREYEDLRREFGVSKYSEDIFYYPTVQTPGKHICEKPVAMLADIISTSSRLGGVVVDMFAGSGSTGEAAIAKGRYFLGFEANARHSIKANARLRRVASLWRRPLFTQPADLGPLFGGLS